MGDKYTKKDLEEYFKKNGTKRAEYKADKKTLKEIKEYCEKVKKDKSAPGGVEEYNKYLKLLKEIEKKFDDNLCYNYSMKAYANKPTQDRCMKFRHLMRIDVGLDGLKDYFVQKYAGVNMGPPSMAYGEGHGGSRRRRTINRKRRTHRKRTIRRR